MPPLVSHCFSPFRMYWDAIGRKRRARADIHGVGAGTSLRQSIRADPLARGQLGQVALLLLFGSVPHQRQRSDADVRAKSRGKTGQHRDVIGDQRRADLVHPQAAILFGNVDRGESQLRSLAQHRLALRPASFRSIAAARGRISSRANCSAVAAIWRCSSFRSSGVKTSSGARDSSKKLPPVAAVMGDAATACIGWDCLLQDWTLSPTLRHGAGFPQSAGGLCAPQGATAYAATRRNRGARGRHKDWTGMPLHHNSAEALSRGFKQEPGATLGFVDPHFDQAGRGVVVGV